MLYKIKGQLKSLLYVNKIASDGFYDSGLQHSTAKFESLQHHRAADINDKQAILLVNLPDNSIESSKQIEAKNLHILKSNYVSAGIFKLYTIKYFSLMQT